MWVGSVLTAQVSVGRCVWLVRRRVLVNTGAIVKIVMTDKVLADSFEDLECPLCMEEIDVTDKYFKPCPCGYQICRFCWNHIKEDLNALCPACRRQYCNENVEFKPVSPEELAKIKSSKKKKEREKKETDIAARKQLANVRVVQKNLVYVLGLPGRLATEEILKSAGNKIGLNVRLFWSIWENIKNCD